MQESSSTTSTHGALIRELTGNAIWVAWYNIIYGGLISLTIIGAIFGVPLLIAGLRLKESLENLNGYAETGSSAELEAAFEKQKTYWLINKILIIVGLVAFVIYLIVLATVFPAIIANMNNANPSFE